MKKINCFLLSGSIDSSHSINEELHNCGIEGEIVLMDINNQNIPLPDGARILSCSLPNSSETLLSLVEESQAEYTLLYTKNAPFKLGLFALQRFIDVMDSTQAPMAYSDYYHVNRKNESSSVPLIDCGSWFVRDDFNFGPLLIFRTSELKRAVRGIPSLEYAALYRTLLLLSLDKPLLHIPEYMYTELEEDIPSSREKQYDYVNPKNREVQLEMEQVFLECLKIKGAWLAPQFNEIDLTEGSFECEASVIIPVPQQERND